MGGEGRKRDSEEQNGQPKCQNARLCLLKANFLRGKATNPKRVCDLLGWWYRRVGLPVRRYGGRLFRKTLILSLSLVEDHLVPAHVGLVAAARRCALSGRA